MNRSRVALAAAGLLVLLVGAAFALRPDVPAGAELEGFARCLAAKGITMYGAEWCPHCQNEKRAFGDAFRYVSYVECPRDPKRCLAAGIAGYPTWIFPDGKKFEGEQGLDKLSGESGCSLPKPNNESQPL